MDMDTDPVPETEESSAVESEPAPPTIEPSESNPRPVPGAPGPTSNIFLDPAFEIFETLDWICNNCTSTFPSSVSIGKHLFTCLNLEPYMSQFQSSDPEPQQRKSISSQAHVEPKKFLCQLCPTMLSSRDSLIRHMRLVHQKFECCTCSKVFDKQSSLILHKKMCRDLRKPRIRFCDFCSKSFSGRTPFVTHLRRAHPNDWKENSEFRCTECPRCFLSRCDLQRHLKTHSRKLFRPKSCTSVVRKRQTCRRNKMHCCTICPAKFLKRRDLSTHASVHFQKPGSSGDGHVCDICSASFTTNRFWNIHRRSVHKISSNYNCDHCEASFPVLIELKRHKSKIHGFSALKQLRTRRRIIPTVRRPFKCTVCPLAFSLRQHLVRHKRKSHNNKAPPLPSPRQCVLCSSQFSRQRDLDDHKFTAHNFKYECPICSAEIKYGHNLKQHILRHASRPVNVFRKPGTSNKSRSVQKPDAENPHVCTICNASFKQVRALDIHLSRAHQNRRNRAGPSMKCKYCLKSFTPTAFRTHHCKSKPHICRICKSGFNTRPTLLKHMHKHGDRPGRPHRCSACKLGFKAAGSLKVHMNRVHRRKAGKSSLQKMDRLPVLEAPMDSADQLNLPALVQAANLKEPPINLQCKKCSNVFSSQANLAFHLKTHLGLFRCTVCHAGFNYSSHLQKHRTIHEAGSETRPYQCTFCRAGFESESTWTYHVNVLHGTAPETLNPEEFKCTVCSKAYSLKSSLARHSKTHLRSRPVQCTICGARFKHPAHLAAHAQVHRIDINTLNGQKVKPNQTYACPTCSRSFPSAPLLVNHEWSEHDGQGYKALVKNNNRRECSLCPMLISSPSRYYQHMRIHTKNKPFPCGSCEASFDQIAHLNTHYQVHDRAPAVGEPDSQAATSSGKEPMTPKVPRSVVPPTTSEASAEVMSPNASSSTGPVECPTCSLEFPSASLLNKHKRSAHVEEAFMTLALKENGRRQCSLCPTGVSSQREYLTHMRAHSRKLTHVCPYCKASFHAPHQLILHKRVHTKAGAVKGQGVKVKPVAALEEPEEEEDLIQLTPSGTGVSAKKCHLCSALVTGATAYLAHIKGHSTMSKPHVCPSCDATFDMPHHLYRHLLAHDKAAEPRPSPPQRSPEPIQPLKLKAKVKGGHEKIHRCHICKVGFERKTELWNHFLEHSSFKPFKCRLCPRKFIYKRKLEKHERKHEQ